MRLNEDNQEVEHDKSPKYGWVMLVTSWTVPQCLWKLLSGLSVSYIKKRSRRFQRKFQFSSCFCIVFQVAFRTNRCANQLGYGESCLKTPTTWNKIPTLQNWYWLHKSEHLLEHSKRWFQVDVWEVACPSYYDHYFRVDGKLNYAANNNTRWNSPVETSAKQQRARN